MPTQGVVSNTPEYGLGDTYPDLVVQLLDGAGNPIYLEAANVVINIAHASYDYYYAPMDRIIDGDPCVVDPDQTIDGNRGWVSWTPNGLVLAGTFHYNFTITFPGGGVQTVAPSGTNSLIVRAPIGGNQYA